MPKKRERRKPKDAAGSRTASGTSPQWVVVALLFGLAFGGVAGFFAGRAMPGNDAAALTDAFGRSPGHPHYNHDHR